MWGELDNPPLEAESVSGTKNGTLILVLAVVAFAVYLAVHVGQLRLVFQWLLGSR
jgi:hypothetical protein